MTRSTSDAVGGEVGDRAAEEADRGRRFLVLEHLDVGEPGGVVDADVDVLPADRTPRRVATRWRRRVAGDAGGRPRP